MTQEFARVRHQAWNISAGFALADNGVAHPKGSLEVAWIFTDHGPRNGSAVVPRLIPTLRGETTEQILPAVPGLAIQYEPAGALISISSDEICSENVCECGFPGLSASEDEPTLTGAQRETVEREAVRLQGRP